MDDYLDRAVAVVGVGAVMPDAPDAPTFWANIRNGRYSISEVDPARWDPILYYDPDPKAADKTYSKIGGWVREWEWDPRSWRLPIMPKVAEAIDDAQKWAVACTHQALTDYGYPERPLDSERVAVVLGNAMAGEKHYETALRVSFPEMARELSQTPSFDALPNDVQRAITEELGSVVAKRYPEITEDSMPGELSNCIAGRVANLFNFRGPNYVVDAACASAMAATASSVEGLIDGHYDAVITGGIDRNMGAATYVKFCKIGALSATGTRPYAEGADGFVMGEGAAVFLLKRLHDAIEAGDRVYAVLLGIAGSSDGKGKGITAPNPVGQKLAVERAWRNAGIAPQTATLVEGHGTSTRVGDVVEHQSMAEVFDGGGIAPGAIALGSVKSNIGHLKGAAGAAGMFKVVMSLNDRLLPPSLNFRTPSPDIDFSRSPFRVNTELREWERPEPGIRRAGVSAFGFGGTNFHAVFEEHVPGRGGNGRKTFAVSEPKASTVTGGPGDLTSGPKAPLQGAAVVGAADEVELGRRLAELAAEAAAGRTPPVARPSDTDLLAPERVAIDFGTAEQLAEKAARAGKALAAGEAAWKMLRGRGVFRGRGPAPKVAFLYTGQGSQYVNMLRTLARNEPLVAGVFDEADRVMEPLLEGRRLTDYLFADSDDPAAMARAEEELRRTEITQPAVLAVDHALTILFDAYGIRPDLVMGHSLGEYAALVAAGALTFEHALEAVSARGREMADIDVEDRGLMAAVIAPLSEIERLVETIDGNVVVANVNSTSQAVIGGASGPVQRAVEALRAAGHHVFELPVSHAFHTSIVAPVSEPLKRSLARLSLRPPVIPLVANVSGELYPTGLDALPQMLEILGRQVASPVQFVKGLHTLYDIGARVFVEVGPKRALHGFTEDVLGERADVTALLTNHPKLEDAEAFNQALCGLYAAGLGTSVDASTQVPAVSTARPVAEEPQQRAATVRMETIPAAPPTPSGQRFVPPGLYEDLGRTVADFLDQRMTTEEADRPALRRPVVVTGAALGLPGTERLFDPTNLGRLLRGEQLIKAIPPEIRDSILDQHITRLIKRPDGSGSFELIDDAADVIKLAARAQAFDPAAEFGMSADRLPALDKTTCMAVAAGFDALYDAGIPLVQHYKTTHLGTRLPERWGLPHALRDDTGVIFASAFPGMDSFAEYADQYYTDKARREQLAALEAVRASLAGSDGAAGPAIGELDRRIGILRSAIADHPYEFDRRFLFRVLSMGHSQFAEIIGARGPNTQVNAACASTTQGIALAEDWIRAGRCRRVIVVAADDVTSDHLLGWIGAGFLASGAAATDEVVEEAATPFDLRRHGMILGMGAAAIVVEEPEAAVERGIRPICDVLAAETANSAYHGTRLDVAHISQVMENLIGQAERRWGIDRREVASEAMFVSHETYTPARGGSASAEVEALRHTFGPGASNLVIANTKGFTGHPMGVGIEDVVAIKGLETGLVPPIPNFKETDPELGELNLSVGGSYPIRYALRLAAGFGSQISMALFRWVEPPDGLRRDPEHLGYAYRIEDDERWKAWLAEMSDNSDAAVEVVQHQLRVIDTEREPIPAELAVAPDQPPQVEPAKATPEPDAAPEPDTALEPEAPTVSEDEAPTVTEDEVRERVLTMVADQTGYPQDMLEMDLDLEADLGVDTVKQAELFATVREAYGIPRDDKLKLRDFPTLTHVVGFVLERAGGAASDAAPTEPPPQPQAAPAPEPDTAPEPAALEPEAPTVSEDEAPTVTEDEVRERVLTMVADQTGYPQDMLEMDLDLEADLGVDTVKQAELFATVREAYGIPRDDKLKLRDFPTLTHVVGFVLERAGGAASDAAPTEPPPQPQAAPAPEPDAAPEPAALEPEAPTVSEDEVRERVLTMVADQTGYPQDMLEMDLDLEADLGVDTVKQAELFATVREAYGIPRDDKLKLRDFPTLTHVVRFVLERAGGSASQPAPAAPAAAEAAPPAVRAEARAGLEMCDRVRRRVPVPVVRPPLALCRPTEVRLGSGSRVVVVSDGGGVGDALVDRLHATGVETLLIQPSEDVDAETVTGQITAWSGSAGVQGVYWLPALDVEPSIGELDLVGWKANLRIRVKLLAATMRALFEQVSGPGTFLVTGSRLGGRHGYDEAGASAPMGGAVTGFAKAYKRERPDCLVKAVDVAASAAASEVADLLLEETVSDRGAVEIGRWGGLRWAIGLKEESVPDGRPGLALGPETTFVVTGAAGSIVSAIVGDLAMASGGSFHLLDLAPEPDPADPDLERFAVDRDGLKKDLAQRIKNRGDRPTPAMVERELAGLERRRAALDAITTVKKAGGHVVYHSLDLRDPEAVAKVIETVRERHGRLDVLLHAAGLDVSRFLSDKSDQEYDLVFDVKADGWFNLLHAVGSMPLGATVSFSSVAGRFGNGGQTDYSAASDLLCKATSSLRSTRPATRGLVIDWTAWRDIGMASRGSIPKMMERAGIDLLAPGVGIPWIRRELVTGGGNGEVLVAERLGALTEELDYTCLDTEAVAARPPRGPMAGEIVGIGVWRPLTVETTLDPIKQSFLDDHRIDGTAVLPGVMGVEGFAEVASALLPGWRVVSVEDVAFLAPFKFYRDEPRTVTLEATLGPGPRAGELVAECRLLGRRELPNQPEPRVTTHFTGRVRLAPAGDGLQETATAARLAIPSGGVARAAAIYRIYFHGPAYQVLDGSWRDGDRQVGIMASGLPDDRQPPDLPLVSMPRLLELCFQTAGVWELATKGRLALPQQLAGVSLLQTEAAPEGDVQAVVTPLSDGESFDADVVDEAGRVHLRMTGYRTVALPTPVDPELLAPLRTTVS